VLLVIWRQCVTGGVVPDILKQFIFWLLEPEEEQFKPSKPLAHWHSHPKRLEFPTYHLQLKALQSYGMWCHSHVDSTFWVVYCLHLQGRRDSQIDDGESMFCQKYGTYFRNNVAFKPSFTICLVMGRATLCCTTILIDTSAILQCCFSYKIYLTANMTGTGHQFYAHIQ